MLNNSYFKIIINFLRNNVFVFFYIVISFSMVFYHECWLDEAHAYVIAKYKNIWEIFQYARYDGHPILWHLLLKASILLKLPYVSIQIVNTTFNCIAVWLLIKYSPFHRVFKFLLVLGYFIFFEYNIVARNYSLCMLLLFSIAVIYESKEIKRYSYIILLLLLAFTHFFGLILSVLIFTLSVMSEDLIKNRRWLLPNVMLCLGYLLIGILLFRLPNEATLISHDQSVSLGSIIFQFSTMLDSLLLIPASFYSFEIFNQLNFLKLLLSLSVFACLIYYMVHRKQLIIILIIYLISILTFRVFIYSGGIWNIGVVWLAIIFFSWISPNSKLRAFQTSLLSLITNIILILHCICGFEWIYLDKNLNFSLSKKYATYINNYNITHRNLSLYFDCNDSWWGEAIVPYLDDDIKVYGIKLVPNKGKLDRNNCLVLTDKFTEKKNNEVILYSSSEPELRGTCSFLIKRMNGGLEPIITTSP